MTYVNCDVDGGVMRTVDWSLSDAKILGVEQINLALAKCKKLAEYDPYWHLMRDFIAIGVNTGLRLSEVSHIEKDDVLQSRLIVVRRKKRHFIPKPMDVKPEIHAILKARADAVEEGYIFPGTVQPCIIVHTGQRKGEREQICVGGHVSLRNIQRRWRLLLEDIGLYVYGRGVHTLRHTAITECYKVNRDIMEAKEFADHNSVEMTQIYAHAVTLKETLNKMPTMV